MGYVFFSSRRRHTRCALVTGVQTCALPIYPLTQRTTGSATELALKPVSEVILDPAAVERFRTRYREAFGAVRDDPLYEAVSAARAHPGMEHWLPLYHQRLVTLLDYLPEAGVTLDYQALEARDARLETIADFHEARRQIEGGGDSGGWVYKALAPEALYLAAAAWDKIGRAHV